MTVTDLLGKEIRVGSLIVHASAYSGSIYWSKDLAVQQLFPDKPKQLRVAEVCTWGAEPLTYRRIATKNVLVVGHQDYDLWEADAVERARVARLAAVQRMQQQGQTLPDWAVRLTAT